MSREFGNDNLIFLMMKITNMIKFNDDNIINGNNGNFI